MILKKKIEQLLNGKFEYEQPQLLFSKEKISVSFTHFLISLLCIFPSAKGEKVSSDFMRICFGRYSFSKKSERVTLKLPSMTFFNSRTFPGQVYSVNISFTSSLSPKIARFIFSL